MMTEEIIIDGINVSACEYRDQRNFCHCDNSKRNEGEERITGRGGCKYNPNCHFKQFKRTEQKLAKALACIDKCVSDFNHEIGTPYYGE